MNKDDKHNPDIDNIHQILDFLDDENDEPQELDFSHDHDDY